MYLERTDFDLARKARKIGKIEADADAVAQNTPSVAAFMRDLAEGRRRDVELLERNIDALNKGGGQE
ncbi:hypothetical protein Q5752_005820 [Cryptotrichosporon argae]